MIRIRVWREDIWAIGTQEVGIPAPDYGKEVGDVASHERETAFYLRDGGVYVIAGVFAHRRVHELVREDEAGYADCCDAARGRSVKFGA